MFCSQCGLQIQGGITSCPRCGAPVDMRYAGKTYFPYQAPPENRHNARPSGPQTLSLASAKGIPDKLLILMAGFCALVAVFLAFLLLQGDSGYQATVEKLVRCRAYADAELKYSVMTPDYLHYLESVWSDDRDRVIERLQSGLDDDLRDYKRVCGDITGVKTTITNDYHFTKDDLASLNRYMKDAYEFEDGIIKDAHIVEVHYDLLGPEGEYSNYFFQLVMKVRGKWTAIAGHLDLDFLEIDWLDRRYLN